jgi:hypothetical protein
VFHHQEVDPVLVADVEDWADVGMAQRGNRLGLAFEPRLQIGVVGDVLGQDLDGDGAVEARIAGLVDLAHAARADLGGDTVRAERGTGLQGHGYGTGTRRFSSSTPMPPSPILAETS